MGTRVVLALTARYAIRPALLDWLLPLNICMASGSVGLLLASALWFYGIQNWTFLVAMIWTVGAVSSATISFTPNFQLLQLNVALFLVPSLVLAPLVGGAPGKVFTIMASVLSVFQVLQGRRLHKAYWERLHNRALASARARELEIARLAAEAASTTKGQLLANMS